MDALKILNAIREEASKTYIARVPLATRNNLGEIADILVNDSRLKNELFDKLIGVLFYQDVKNRTFTNPLAIFKSERIPLGLDMQRLYINPAKDLEFDKEGKSLMNLENSDVKAIYFRKMRKSKYKVSISSEQILENFTTMEKLTSFMQSQLNSLYNGDMIDEWMLTKNLFCEGLRNGLIKYVEVSKPLTDAASVGEYVKASQKVHEDFFSPSSLWNGYSSLYPTEEPAVTWVEKPEDLIHVVTNDVKIEVGYESLAKAYNVEYATLKENTVSINAFDTAPAMLSVILDKAGVLVKDNIENIETFRNGDGMFTNYFRHHHQTYGLCAFSNMCAFVVKTDVTVDHDTASISSGTPTHQIVATVTPEAMGLTYESTDEKVATVDKTGLITRVAAGTCKILVIGGGYKIKEVAVTSA